MCKVDSPGIAMQNQIASYCMLVFNLQKCFLLLQVHDKIGPSGLWSLM